MSINRSGAPMTVVPRHPRWLYPHEDAMMKTIKGPGIYLAQFATDDAPFNTLPGLAGWVADKGFAGLQIPTWDTRLIDMKLAAESKTYCDDLKGVVAEKGLEL